MEGGGGASWKCCFGPHGSDPVKGSFIAWPPPPSQADKVRARLSSNVASVVACISPLRPAARCMQGALLRTDPWVNLALGIILLRARCYQWAAVCLTCVCMPLIVLCIAFNDPWHPERRQSRRAAFKKAFGWRPHPLGIMFCVLELAARTALCCEVSLQLQCLARLILLSGLVDGSAMVFLQAVVAVEQMLSKRHFVTPYLLAVSLAQSAFTLYAAVTYLCEHAWLTHDGDWEGLLDNLARLGDGMVPPDVLDRMLWEPHTVIVEELSRIDAKGLASISRAASKSRVLETLQFEDTGIQQSPATRYAHHWQLFCDELSSNRARLRRISFNPAVPHDWSFGRALRLELVENGGQAVFTFEQPCSQEFFEAVERDDSAAGALSRSPADAAAGLLWAARAGRLRALAGIIATGEVDAAAEASAVGGAAAEDQRQSLRMLLAFRADPNALLPGEEKSTALHEAAELGQTAAVLELLAAGAAPGPLNVWGETPVHASAVRDADSVIRALLQAAASPFEPTAACQHTPLHFCASLSAPRCARVLLEAKAEVEAEDADGCTPLILAAAFNSVTVLRALLKARASLEAKDVEGHTALDMAAGRGHEESASVLRLALGMGQSETGPPMMSAGKTSSRELAAPRSLSHGPR